jgi:hypothetical protein
MQLYINKNGQQQGPYPIDHVKAWLSSGHLNENDLAWYEGSPSWMPLQLVPGLREAVPALQTTNQNLGRATNIKIVCPKCESQNSYMITDAVSVNYLQCPTCRVNFLSRVVRIRSKNSRGSKKEFRRRFSIRVYDMTGYEDLIEFVNAGLQDFELRSKDFAIFSYLGNKLRVVQNETINRYWKVSSPSCFLATYVYGPNSKEVSMLRHFRDEVLLGSGFLSPVVPLYYAVSKKAVYRFGGSAMFKELSCVLLKPLIWCVIYHFRGREG